MNNNSSTKLIFEACVGSYSSAKEAEKRGASRIELCDNLKEGGTTPSYGTIKLAKKNLKIPIFVIIRPRGGDFIYSAEEIEKMKEDIIQCKSLGVDGVVLGILNEDYEVDIDKMASLIEKAQGMQITFHMAFDEILDRKKAIDTLVTLGVHRILTKGSLGGAIEGKEMLKEFIEYSKGRIIILPGGGVTKDNYHVLREYLGNEEFHGTKIV
jgi:copper homeostasis protein